LRLTAAALAAAALLLPASASAQPACFAAAARDTGQPCHNPALRMSARPGLTRSLLTPSYPCRITRTLGRWDRRADGALSICEFGVPKARAERTAVLLGDSHAMAWRAAVAGTLRELGWHGVDLTRSHCAFSAATRALPEPDEIDGCQRFNRRVLKWLRKHPEASVVFAAHQTGGSPYFRIGRRSEFNSQVYGLRLAWRSLPVSVEKVFVIRDNPANHNGYAVQQCVARARRAGRAPGPFCSRPRSEALRRDAHEAAVRRMHNPRFVLADLTRFMCGPRRCFPVVGGARVTKDGTHLTRVFSASLAPYLTRTVLGVL
jgi:hypothetical protein